MDRKEDDRVRLLVVAMETDTGEIVTFFMETTAEPLDLGLARRGDSTIRAAYRGAAGRWGGERLDG